MWRTIVNQSDVRNDAVDTSGYSNYGENKPFAAGIVVHIRHKYHLSSHADRLRAQGLLGTVKSWTKAEIFHSNKANDKNERLYERPIYRDPRLTAPTRRPRRRLDRRYEPSPTTGAHGALKGRPLQSLVDFTE
jgi:hypothetical protein